MTVKKIKLTEVEVRFRNEEPQDLQVSTIQQKKKFDSKNNVKPMSMKETSDFCTERQRLSNNLLDG